MVSFHSASFPSGSPTCFTHCPASHWGCRKHFSIQSHLSRFYWYFCGLYYTNNDVLIPYAKVKIIFCLRTTHHQHSFLIHWPFPSNRIPESQFLKVYGTQIHTIQAFFSVILRAIFTGNTETCPWRMSTVLSSKRCVCWMWGLAM